LRGDGLLQGTMPVKVAKPNRVQRVILQINVAQKTAVNRGNLIYRHKLSGIRITGTETGNNPSSATASAANSTAPPLWPTGRDHIQYGASHNHIEHNSEGHRRKWGFIC
jgi:hypothetical protein